MRHELNVTINASIYLHFFFILSPILFNLPIAHWIIYEINIYFIEVLLFFIIFFIFLFYLQSFLIFLSHIKVFIN